MNSLITSVFSNAFPRFNGKTVQKAAISTAAKIAGGGMAGIAAAKTVFNIAAETAKEYEKKLGEVLLNIGEGLKTAATANVESQIERAEKLEEESRKRNEFLQETTVTMVLANERDLKIQGEMAVGLGKEMRDKAIRGGEFAVNLGAFMIGQNPGFPAEMGAALAAAYEGVKYSLSHPKETLEAFEIALSTATPEDMGRLLADFYVGQVTGVGLAGGTSKVVNTFKKITPNSSTLGAVEKVADSRMLTVWDRITPVELMNNGTEIPKSFYIRIDGETLYVNPNGAKHMHEYITRDNQHIGTFTTPVSS